MAKGEEDLFLLLYGNFPSCRRTEIGDKIFNGR